MVAGSWTAVGIICKRLRPGKDKNMASNKGVITETGRKKLCMAHAGDGSLPKIAKMVWGDGGVDEKGAPKATTGTEVGLYNKLLEKAVEGHSYVNEKKTTCRYKATLEKGELTGKEISEMGLLDADGDLIAYRTFTRKGKDEDIPQEYDMDEIF
nr:MAG TPA: tail-collar fiber protein [Caudoviricetes sp.]